MSPKPPFPPAQFGSRVSSAFTLIELLVVISIVGVLAAILLPVFGRATEQGHITATLSNMRQMGVAFIAYAGEHNYQLPGRVRQTAGSAVQQDKWIIALQPYYQNPRVLICPIAPVGGASYNVTDPSKLLSNEVNNTSYIANGYNDIGAFTDTSVIPQLNNIAQPTNTILLGIPYPQKNNFYMDFDEHNETDILNRTAFLNTTSVYVFSDGSSRLLRYATSEGGTTVDMTKQPPNPTIYTDWLWQVNKDFHIGGN